LRLHCLLSAGVALESRINLPFWVGSQSDIRQNAVCTRTPEIVYFQAYQTVCSLDVGHTHTSHSGFISVGIHGIRYWLAFGLYDYSL